MIKPLKIGTVEVQTPIGLAPMAGVTDEIFRRICVEQGAGLVCTEMVSAKAIVFKNKNTTELMTTNPDERPAAVQLFGSDPDALSMAASMISEQPFDIVDFNMGCPVPKVVKNHEGSALMADPKAAEKAIRALVKSAGKPVTVKIRAGFTKDNRNAVRIARIAQENGAAAVTVHGRTRDQFYLGKADWEIIGEVKSALEIPVFGNGDITDESSAEEMIRQTGCDGIMIGRAAMGDPWIFSRIRHYFETGEKKMPPAKEEIVAMILRQAAALAEQKGEYRGIRQMRSHAAWYIKGFRNAAKLRRMINTAETLNDFKEILSGI